MTYPSQSDAIQQWEQPGTDLQAYDDLSYTGLEEFSITDARLGRLKIEHKEGMIVDDLSGRKFPAMQFIGLNFLKQRILWPIKLQQEPEVMCKSVDGKRGYPTLEPENPAAKFPLNAAQIPQEAWTLDSEVNRQTIDCESCRLKEWGSMPNDTKPWCNEQRTVPMLFRVDENEPWAFAVMTFQRTGMKPMQNFAASFSRSKQPFFSGIGYMTLTAEMRGNNLYQVPKIEYVGPTDRKDWPEYIEQSKEAGGYLHRAPRTSTEDKDEFNAGDISGIAADNTWTPSQASAPMAPPTAMAPPMAPPAYQPPAPAAPADINNQSFASPGPIPAQRPAPVAPAAPPVAPPVAPVQQPVQAVPQTFVPDSSDDDLPF